ncbi:hypothetical protein [Paenibacillus wynnii]|uniref:hypothetical protein n=1 Tax=Paenibacillus wynnii TaxID=268407 RepID=UPI0027940E6E|nr:hypothetical protein [Paenibacillus wynnii]MDQ0193062.1 hypothetical protein [Paenibacillus wynnii]
MDANRAVRMNEVSLFRLYLLRGLYLLIIVGLGIVVWPGVIHQEEPWELMEGVVACMLAAFSALSVLGLRYPLQMLPLLLWELVWKSIWLIVVALPLWFSGQMDESTWATASSCLLVVIFPFVIPWRYVFTHYVKKHGDRWH